jgi:hypothetical protein
MEQNIKAHQELHNSEAICKEVVNKYYTELYQTHVQRILEDLNKDRPEQINSWFTEKEKITFLKLKETTQLGIQKQFLDQYKRARKQACQNQMKRLIRDISPTEFEFENIKPDILRANLLARLIKKQKEPIYAENRTSLVSEIIAPILREAERQRQEQKRFVEGIDSGGHILPREIEKHIREALNKYIQSLHEKHKNLGLSTKVYEVFPSVNQKIGMRSALLTRNAFLNHLTSYYCSIDPNGLYHLIKDNLNMHTESRESWLLCYARFKDQIYEGAIEKYTTLLEPEKKKEGKIFFHKEILKDQFQDASENLIERNLRKDFVKTRAGIAKEQYKTFFSPLFSNQWRPSYDDIDSRYHDSSLEILVPFSFKGISNGPYQHSVLLEETKGMVLEYEKKVLEEGLRALREQMNLVETLESEMKEYLLQSVYLPSLDIFIDTYTNKVLQKWKSHSLNLKYPNLFERVEKDIDKRAKAILLSVENMKKSDVIVYNAAEYNDSHQAKQKRTGDNASSPSENNPGDIKGGAGGQKQKNGAIQLHKGTKSPEVIIDLNYKGGGIIIRLTFISEGSCFEMFINENIERDAIALMKIQENLSKWLAQDNRRSKKLNIYVLTRIFHRKICYGLVYDLRNCADQAIQKYFDSQIKLHWYDDLCNESEWDNLKITEEQKRKSMLLKGHDIR